MHVSAHPVQHHSSLCGRIEFGAWLEDVFPDPEHFVNSVQRVDLEFVVGIPARDENLEIVLFVDFRIAFRTGGPNIRLLGSETEVAVVVVPEHRDASVEPRRLAGYDIDKTSRSGSRLPGGFIQFSVDENRTGGAIASVFSDAHYGSDLGFSAEGCASLLTLSFSSWKFDHSPCCAGCNLTAHPTLRSDTIPTTITAKIRILRHFITASEPPWPSR